MKARRYSLFLAGLIVLSIGVSGCGKESLSKTAAVYDQLELRLINQEEYQADRWAQAVGALVYGTPETIANLENISNCTGIAISKTLVLTAGHCMQREPFAYVFNPMKIAKNGKDFPLEIEAAEGGLVRINSRAPLVDEAQSFIDQPAWLRMIYQDAQRDFAVYRAPVELPVEPLDLFDTTDQDGKMALYGFPNGIPLSVAGPCKGLKAKSGIDFWHDCDSLGGSSGALLVNVDQQKAVGLHHFGGGNNLGSYYLKNGQYEGAAQFAEQKEKFWKEGAQAIDWDRAEAFWGCEKIDSAGNPDYSCVTALGLNRALLFSEIRRRLQEHAPDIYAELQNSWLR